MPGFRSCVTSITRLQEHVSLASAQRFPIAKQLFREAKLLPFALAFQNLKTIVSLIPEPLEQHRRRFSRASWTICVPVHDGVVSRLSLQLFLSVNENSSQPQLKNVETITPLQHGFCQDSSAPKVRSRQDLELLL